MLVVNKSAPLSPTTCGHNVTKILIVEDEPTVAEAMSMVLASAGHHIVGIAGDADAAIWRAATARPDLVLMDIKLANNSDGIEAARRLLADRPVHVIFVSSYLDSPTRERAASVCPAGFLVKPYSPQKLLELVSALSA